MIIYSNGCSHTHTHCVEKDEIWSSIVMKKFTQEYFMFISSTNVFNLNDTNKENILINESRCGAGNDHIFHRTLETLIYLIQNNKKPDYVFIQWSGPNRRQHCLPSGEMKNVNLHDNIEYHIKFEPMGSLHTIHYMFSLQEFLKKENIKYYFFNYMELDSSVKFTSIYNEIDMDKFIDFGFGKDILTKGILNMMKEKGYSCDNLGHPNIIGNEYIANEIIKKL